MAFDATPAEVLERVVRALEASGHRVTGQHAARRSTRHAGHRRGDRTQPGESGRAIERVPRRALLCQPADLDLAYVERWVKSLGLEAQWASALATAGSTKG